MVLLKPSQTAEVTDSATLGWFKRGCSESTWVSKRLLANTVSKRI